MVKSRQWDRQPTYPKLVIEITNVFDMSASASENPFRGAV
jgi:Uma2 family endonuclease